MAAHNLYLKNSQVYDVNGDPIQGLLEAKAVLKIQTSPVNRLRQGETVDVVSYYTEVSMILTAQNASFKYFILDQITKGKTPIIPLLIGEHHDKENGVKERVRLTNIRLAPEEVTIFEAKAEGTDKAQYEIRGRTTDKPDVMKEFPEYVE